MSIFTEMKFVLVVLIFILSLIGVICLTTGIYRMTLDYNEQGVYFNPDSVSTYSSQAIGAYFVVAICSLILAVGFCFLLKHYKKTA